MKTLKKIAAAYNGVSLILRIAIGLVVGVILALVCPGATWLKELGNLFVGALKGIAPVLVFVIVASALAQGSSKLDRRVALHAYDVRRRGAERCDQHALPADAPAGRGR